MRILPLVLVACSGAVPPGSPDSPVDSDGDGWTPLDGDCDDTDAAVNPDGIDIPGDDVDQDCSGGDAETLPSRGLEPGDLVLTEIQKDPIGVDAAAGEWFELRNDTDVAVDLNGLVLRNEDADTVQIDASVVVEPGEHVVLGAIADPGLNGEVEVDHAYGPTFRIANASGSIEVLGRENIVLAGLVWDPSFPDVDGRTMQRSPDAAGDLPTDWCIGLSVYGIGGWGTPGAPNVACTDVGDAVSLIDVFAGELVITEIMKDPLAVDGAFGEWVEIRNDAPMAVDLLGLELVDEEGEGIQVEQSSRLEPGAYAVFAASDDPDLNGGLPAVVAEWGSAFALRNSEDEVTLRFGTRVFDTVIYDNGDTFPDPEGISFGTSPGTGADANDDGAAWCVASEPYGDGDLGTPGGPNPPCP